MNVLFAARYISVQYYNIYSLLATDAHDVSYNISWQDGLRNDRVRELTGHDRVLTKMREQRLQWWDLGVIYNRWRIEDKQNRHSIGFLRDHAKSVDRASPGMITLRKTLRVVESQ